MAPGGALQRGFEFLVDLRHEAIRVGLVRRLHLGVELGRQARGDGFLLRLALLDHLQHAIANRENHVAVSHEGRAVHGWAVTGDDLGARPGHADEPRQAFEHSIERAAVGAVDVGEADRTEEISAHDHVVIYEADHGVAIGVRAQNGKCLGLFAIQIERDRAFEGDLRQ